MPSNAAPSLSDAALSGDAYQLLLQWLPTGALSILTLASFAMLARPIGAMAQRAARAAAQPVAIRVLVGQLAAGVVLAAGVLAALACLDDVTPSGPLAHELATTTPPPTTAPAVVRTPLPPLV